jgi:hypothetical protein
MSGPLLAVNATFIIVHDRRAAKRGGAIGVAVTLPE